MTVDKQEIQALALACDPAKCADEAEEDRRLAEFHSELTPEVVLALLAESDMLTAQRLMHVRLNLSLRARRKIWVTACEKAEDELLDALAKCGQLKAENDRLMAVIQAVINEVPSRVTRNDGNAPGHCHVVPGIWDEDNGDRAGTECGWCKVWAAAVAISKEASQ